MDPASKTILQALGMEVMHFDELMHITGLQTGPLLSSLLSLEIAGMVRQYPGKSFGVTLQAGAG
ncbi:MAG: hypothetical protein HKN13_10945 [Rhodothermales bacterium]|nr:hypothetical protein [Rhodothermales bacterium]